MKRFISLNGMEKGGSIEKQCIMVAWQSHVKVTGLLLDKKSLSEKA